MQSFRYLMKVLFITILPDHSKGFGGKYGVQTERVDQVSNILLRELFINDLFVMPFDTCFVAVFFFFNFIYLFIFLSH